MGEEIRRRLSEVGRMLYSEGLTTGSSGNISARIPGGSCFIKPSGARFCDLEEDSFIEVDIASRRVLRGEKTPSIETPFHTAIYLSRHEVNSVVHVHPRYSIIFSILGKSVEPLGMDVMEAPALARGVKLARFAPPGSEELAVCVVEALREADAVLMPHHGLTVVGRTIEEAARNAIIAERLAKLQYDVMLVGEPKKLPDSFLKFLVEGGEKA